MKILIADHSPTIREGITFHIRDLPDVKIVGETSTAQDTLLAADATSPDLIIMDFPLKDGQGTETVHRLKQREPPPIIIIFTNLSSPEYRKACLQTGADYFLDKSYELNRLRDILREFGNPEWPSLNRRSPHGLVHCRAYLCRKNPDKTISPRPP